MSRTVLKGSPPRLTASASHSPRPRNIGRGSEGAEAPIDRLDARVDEEAADMTMPSPQASARGDDDGALVFPLANLAALLAAVKAAQWKAWRQRIAGARLSPTRLSPTSQASDLADCL